MELEVLQKIWNEQKGETMYVIDEHALHHSITRRKNAASQRMTNVEIGLMIINSLTGVILFIDAIIDNEGVWDYAFSIAMLLTVLFLISFRKNRLRQEKTFDRSMLGELDHAISNSNSMIKISTIMVKFYLLPVGIFTAIKMIVFEASIENHVHEKSKNKLCNYLSAVLLHY